MKTKIMNMNQSHVMSICLFVFLALGIYRAAAQESDFDTFSANENIPKSPEAGTLGQFGNTTGNPYNGKANISVPIYTLNFEGL